MKLTAMLLGLVLLLSGCTVLQSTPAAARVSIEYATMRLIERAEAPADRAIAVIQLVDSASRFLDTEEATVPDLASRILARIDMDGLTPSDRLLAAALVDAVSQELSARVGEGLIPGQQLLQVRAVLGWVADAAALY